MHIKSVTKTLAAGANEFKHSIGNQDDLVLLGVNLAETDTPDGNPIPDTASVWLQDPSEGNTLSLGHGDMRNGQIAGYGCMPLQRGVEIVGKIWHARSGYHGKFCLFLATRGELGQFSPSWSPAVAAVPAYQHGKLRVISLDGVADDITTLLRPDDGYIWQVILAWTQHTSVNMQTLQWSFYDGTDTIDMTATAAVDSTIRHHLPLHKDKDANVTSAPIILTYDVYAIASINALSAGKKLNVRALVLEHAA